MAHHSAIMAISLLTLVCLVGAVLAGPFQRSVEEQCATQCPISEDDKFNYQPGNRYEYNYRGVNYITVAGGRKQQKAEITGIAQIYVKDRCELSLQLRNIELSSEVDPEEAAALIQKLRVPLSFSWVNGHIENICASQEETDVSENIKKGILSAIINTMQDWNTPSEHKEVDSLGNCQTKYEIVRDLQSSVTIRKEKSLKTCDNRHTGVTALISQSYSSPESDMQTLPIFSDEKVVCEQEIQDNIIQRVVCKEQARVKPLSKQDSIVEFQGEIHLSLAKITKATSMPSASSTERKTILYAHLQDQDIESREHETSEILSELCPKTEGLLHPTVSKLYYRLIMVLKGLPATSVQRIYESLKKREICSSPKTMDIFLDALPMAGTEGTIKLMVDLLQSKEVTGLKAKLWPASFAMIPNPNAEAISAVLPLIASEEKSRPVLLGLSAMIYRVCSQNDCDQIPAVREAMTILHQGLGRDCSSEKQTEVVSILKAFGNMGYLGPAQDTVIKCAQATDKHISLRLAAIEAFRRYNKPVPSEIREIYASNEEDFEVRIAALTSLIKNLDSKTVQTIKDVLENDRDEQVVAFTSSLVKNWKETSSPLKQSIRRQLQAVEIKREDISYWENSKNIELSAFNVPTNLGASVESNIIHAPGSKIPRSFTSKIDIDLFGSNINLFEFGVRAEGMEKAVKKLLGVDESRSMKKSWFPLRSSSSSEEETSEASFFLRTMGTEFLDLSVSDFTSVGNMMQVADVVNKLAQGEKADFAHSFLFMNTKLIIPSVTGRSYIFGMIGSATVALTADGKFDVINLMSSPRNCHIEGRLQPSANIEFATTVGIHSDKARPDIKIVTQFHSEGDVAAKVQIKDSHMIEARLDMPNEKVQLLKISTELFEVDANNEEKRIIEDMQTKVDYCIRSLEKPFGLKICGKFETPSPFVSRSFPYARGLGNLEISIKKSDPSMKGYHASLEIPKRISDSMTYRFTIDTPASSIKRKFQGQLELKKSPSGEREFKLEMQSPFKDISTSGSYLWQPELLQSSIVVITDKSKRYSMKAVVEMKMSGTENVIKPHLQWTLPGREPVSVAGSVTYLKSRKHQILVDLRSNKAGSKPIIFTANLMRDGRLDFSKNSNWKMSADFVTKTPIFTSKFHSTLGKRSQSLSSTFSMDYETQRSKKQSIKFTSELQHNSATKASATALFQMTQLPKLNWQLNWDAQGIPGEALKNEILLKYGRNPESTYLRILQSCHKGDSRSLSEGRVTVQMPQFNIDSELKVGLNLHPRESSDLQVQADLRYKGDKHIKSLLQLKSISKSPVKLAVKAQLEYPGRKMSYEDQIEESSRNVYEGRSRLQWQENQRATFQYKYKMMSDHSMFHHEMETALHAPFLSSPIYNKGLIRASKREMDLETSLELKSQSTYFLQAKIAKRGVSKLQLRSPIVDTTMEVNNGQQKKSANLDIQLKSRRPRHITALASVSLDSKKSLEAELLWDADRNQQKKVSLTTDVELSGRRSRYAYNIVSKLQLLDILALELSCQGRDSLQGTHELSVDMSGRNIESMGLTAKQEMTPERLHFTGSLKKNQRTKAELEIMVQLKTRSMATEMQVVASVKSADRSFQDKTIEIKHSFTGFQSSQVQLESSVTIALQPGKEHCAEIEYTSSPRQSKDLKLVVKTPYRKFEKQELHLSHKKSSGSDLINVEINVAKKDIALSTDIQSTQSGMSFTCMLRSPFPAASDVKLHAEFENQRSQKQVQGHFELNGQRKCEIAAKYASRHGRQIFQSNFKSIMQSEIAININSEIERQSFNHEIQIMRDSSPVMSFKVSKQASNEELTCQLELKREQQTLMDVKLTKESSRSTDKYAIKANGPFSPVSLSVQATKNDENSISLILNACQESSQKQCVNLKGYYKRESGSSKYRMFHKITLDIEKQRGQSQVDHICNIHYLLAQQENSVKSKMLFDINEKRIGYELNIQSRHHEGEPCQMDIHIFLPSRTMRSVGNLVHSSEKLSCSFEIIPDASVPSQKLSVELSHDASRGREVNGHISLKHNALEQPILVKYQVQKSSSQLPVSAKIELDYSRDSKDKLTAEMSVQRERRQLQTFTTRLYNGAQDLDLALKLSQQQSSQRDIFVCDWSYKSMRSGLKSGSLAVKLSDKKSDWPQTAEITVEGPSSKLTAVAQTKWTSSPVPSEVQLRLLSKEKTLGEILFHTEGQCADLEIKRQDPLWRNRVCLRKNEQQKVKLISLESFYQEQKCLDMSVDIDPSRSHVAKVAVQWKREQFRDALKSLKEFRPQVKKMQFKKIYHELEQTVAAIAHPMKQKIVQPLTSAVVEECHKFMREQVEEIRHFKEILEQFLQKLPEMPSLEKIDRIFLRYLKDVTLWFREKFTEYLNEQAPEWVRELYHTLKEMFDKYWRKYCSRNSLCYQIKHTYERRGIRHVNRLLRSTASEKFNEIQRRSKRSMSEVRNWFENFTRRVFEITERWVEMLRKMIPSWENSKLIQKWRNMYERNWDTMISQTKKYMHRMFELFNKILDKTLHNKDFEILKVFVHELKEETQQAWNNLDAKKLLQPIRENILEKYPKMWLRERVDVQDYNVSEGKIMVQLHHPIDNSRVQLVKNTFIMLRNKYQSRK